jgi:hypothetical protein
VRIAVAVAYTVSILQKAHPQFKEDEKDSSTSNFIRDFSTILRTQLLAYARRVRRKRVAKRWDALGHTAAFQKWFTVSIFLWFIILVYP